MTSDHQDHQPQQDEPPDDETAAATPGLPARVIDQGRAAQERARTSVDTARRRWPVLEYGIEVLSRWRQANGSVLAGHLAYRLVVFLIPFALLIIAVIGYTGSQSKVQDNAEGFGVGRALAETVADASAQASDSRVQLVAVAGFATLTAAWSLLASLQVVIAAVWGIEHKREPGAVKRLAKFLGAGTLLFAVYAVRQALTRSGLVFTALGTVLSMAATGAAILGLTRMLPRRATRWVDLVPGALVAGIGVTLLNGAGGWYFSSKLQKSAELYGTVGIVVTTMLYIFLAAEVLVLAVVVDTVWLDRDTIGRGAPPPDAPDPDAPDLDAPDPDVASTPPSEVGEPSEPTDRTDPSDSGGSAA